MEWIWNFLLNLITEMIGIYICCGAIITVFSEFSRISWDLAK
jgi:hypothetical protein